MSRHAILFPMLDKYNKVLHRLQPFVASVLVQAPI
jgi:hypothetical protein